MKHSKSNETNVQLNYNSELQKTPSKKQPLPKDAFTKLVKKDQIKSESKYQHNPGYSMQQQYQQSHNETQQLQRKLEEKELQIEQEKQAYELLYRYLENNKQKQQFSYYNQQIQHFQEQIKEKEDMIEDQNLLLNHQEDQSKQQSDKFENYISQQKKLNKQFLQVNKNLESKLQEIESQYEMKQQEYQQLESDFEIAKQQSIKQQEESAQKNSQQADNFGNQINELKKLHEQENILLQNKVKEKESALEKEKSAHKQIQRDLESAKQSIKQQEENTQKNAQQADNLGNQMTELKKLHEQENIRLLNKVKEKENQLEKEKSARKQVQRDLESAKQQSIKQQEESAQKNTLQADNFGNQINELKKLHEQENKHLENQINELKKQHESEIKRMQTKVQKIYRQLEKEKQVNTSLQKDLQIAKQLSIKQQEENLQKIVDTLSFDSNLKKGDALNQEIKHILTKLNPNTEIVANQVEFTKAHQIVAQNQPDEKQKSILKVKNDQIVQSYQQSQIGNQQNNSQNQNSSHVMPCLLALQSMYHQDGIQTFITDQPVKNLEKEDKIYKIQQDLLQSGLHNQASYYSLEINKNTNLYDYLLQQSSANQNLTSFLQTFKNEIGKSVNSKNPQNDVTILKIGFNKTPKIDFQINSNDLSKNEIQKKLTLSDIGASASEKNLLEYAKLSIEMFNPQYNMTWTDQHKGKHDTRGQLKFFNQVNPVNHCYKFPVGYTGYALNIERYGDDKSWISSNADDKTWIVLFHGTNENAISGITKDNLQPGKRNACGGKQCRITNTTIKVGVKENVYLTDKLEHAEQYAPISSPYEGKKYIIIFQCRVNPKGVKSPNDYPTYYTVEDNTNIRPYRILLKETN